MLKDPADDDQGWDWANTATLNHIENLIDEGFHTLAVVRHPYRRLISGYTELEMRWKDQYHSAMTGPSSVSDVQQILASRAFWQLPTSTERFVAWWSDFVLGNLYTHAGNGCLHPMRELYHLLPMAASYMRSPHHNQYLGMDHILDVEALAENWGKLLQAWNLDPDHPDISSLMSTKANSRRTSETSLIVQRVLANSPEVRASIDAFYAQDFACFGYTRTNFSY